VLGGWYFSGDVGYVANGHLFVKGRKKELIIVERSPALQPGDLEPDTPLLSSGILDSLTLIDWVAYVDQVYGVKLADVIDLNAHSSDTPQQLVDSLRRSG
jgi:long-subunit acyl-CoA synthetase (AMP-forming)